MVVVEAGLSESETTSSKVEARIVINPWTENARWIGSCFLPPPEYALLLILPETEILDPSLEPTRLTPEMDGGGEIKLSWIGWRGWAGWTRGV